MQNQNDGGTGVYCRIGGETTVVDSKEICENLGGKVVPPKKPGGGICGGCGAAIIALAQQFGMTGYDVGRPWREFLELAVKKSPDGQQLLKFLAKADGHISLAIRDNPAVLGDVTMALIGGAEFAKLVLAPPGGRLDTLKLPTKTFRHFQKSLRGLRQGSTHREFHKVLDFLELELKRWSRKTVAHVRQRFLQT